MSTNGAFEYTNGISINENLDQNRIREVIDHEMTHAQLYATTYGLFMMMLEKNAAMCQQGDRLIEWIFMSMNRMQEAIAINVEHRKIYSREGKDSYTESIERLKCENNAYYNHFKRLACMNNFMNHNENGEEVLLFLIRLGRLALNVDLSKIPFEDFQSKKDYDTFVSNEENRHLVPNSRFDDMLSYLFRDIDNGERIRKILSATIDLDDYHAIERNAYDKACKVYKKYPLADQFIEHIKSVRLKVLNEKYAALEVRPKRLDSTKKIKTEFVKDRSDFIALQKPGDIVWVGGEFSGFEGYYVIAIHREEYGEKRIYAHLIVGDIYAIIECLTQIRETIVFDKLKIITKIGHNSIKSIVEKKPIYVDIDVPIVSQIERIKDFFAQGYYGFYELNDHSVLVCKKKQAVLFASVVKEAQESLDELFEGTICKNDDKSFVCDDIRMIYNHCRGFETFGLNDLENDKIKAFLHTKNSRERHN